MPLRFRFLCAAGIGVVLVLGIATPLMAAVPLGGRYGWKAAGIFATTMVIAAARIESHHPFARLGPANITTIVRTCVWSLVAACIGERPDAGVAWVAVVGAAIVAVLDGVDGWLARRSAMSSAFGARFDVEVDALLILVLSILVWRHGKAGPWIVTAGLMRYLFVAAMAWLGWMQRSLRPTFRGKTVAVVNMMGLDVALGPIVPYPISALAAGATLAALTWSFALDVRRLWRNEG